MEAVIQSIGRAGPRGNAGPRHDNRLVVAPVDFAATSPFLLLAEDWFAPPAGFPTHPHRGMETVTFVLEGALEHADHTGANSILHAGDVQWMTAGQGVLHSEMPHGAEGVHTLQLWLNLPAEKKRTRARYLDQKLAETPVLHRDGATVRVYGGRQGGLEHSHGSTWPMTLLDVALAPGGSFDLEIPAGQRGFLYVLDGRAALGAAGREVGAEQVAWLAPATDEAVLPIRAMDAFRALLYAGPVIAEPVVARGPFVMNTMDEIRQAYADYQSGHFV